VNHLKKRLEITRKWAGEFRQAAIDLPATEPNVDPVLTEALRQSYLCKADELAAEAEGLKWALFNMVARASRLCRHPRRDAVRPAGRMPHVSERIETLEEIRARTSAALAFDGVYRPHIWLAVDQWQAVAYTNDGRFGTRTVFEKAMYKTEAEAQAACDRANKQSANKPSTLF